MEVEARAPGKVILTGEHAVVHGYAAVAASLALHTRCHIKSHPFNSLTDNGVSLNLVDLSLNLHWSLEEIKDLAAAIQSHGSNPNADSEEIMSKLKYLVDEKHLPEAKIGIASGIMAFLFMYSSIIGLFPSTVTISSDLPIGAGLGSSASFCVSLAAAFLAMAKVSADVKQDGVDYITSSVDKSLNLGEDNLELINKWAFEGEKIIHGRPSGIDNTVSTFGYIVKLRKGSLTCIQKSIPLKILLTNTKVGRNTKALVAGVGERAIRHPKPMTSVFEAIDAITEEAIGILQSFSEWEKCRCEQEGKLEELVEINQGLLQSIGVSHASIDAICKTTSKYQLRSKLTGAGGGGCVLTIIPDQITSKTLNKVKGELEAQGYDCFEAAIGGPGVQVTAKFSE